MGSYAGLQYLKKAMFTKLTFGQLGFKTMALFPSARALLRVGREKEEVFIIYTSETAANQMCKVVWKYKVNKSSLTCVKAQTDNTS